MCMYIYVHTCVHMCVYVYLKKFLYLIFIICINLFLNEFFLSHSFVKLKICSVFFFLFVYYLRRIYLIDNSVEEFTGNLY